MALKIKKLPPTRAVRFPIRSMFINSPEHIVLLVRWSGSKEYQAELANNAARSSKATEAERNLAIHRAIARHLIDGWENVLTEGGEPEPYTPDGGLEILDALSDRLDVLHRLYALIREGDEFLDAGDLGNG